MLLGLGGIATLIGESSAGNPGGAGVLWLVWPGLLVAAVLGLRKYYTLAPSQSAGLWQLQLHDLILASLYVGFWLCVTRQLLPHSQFLSAGVTFAFANGVAFIVGALAAARLRNPERLKRVLYAVSYGTRLIGLVGLAAVIAAVVMNSLWDPYSWPRALLTSNDGGRYEWQLTLHQLSLLCLPAGLVMMHFMPSAPAARRGPRQSRRKPKKKRRKHTSKGRQFQ